MPNWCQNRIKISHNDVAMMNKICDAINKGKLCETFSPTPEHLLSGEGWYEWRIENWGTKWDICESHSFMLNRNGTSGDGGFSTAWSPPIELLQKLEAIGYEVECAYLETGIGFGGVYAAGEDDETGDIYTLFENDQWAENINNDMLCDMLQFEYDSWLEYKQQEASENEEA
jgi:hypothetical protein